MGTRLNGNRIAAALAITVAGIGLVASPADATDVLVQGSTDFSASPITFTYGDSTFTLSATGDWFSPTAVSTSGTGQFNTIFGSPTSDFVNRGVVTFGPNDQYAAFSSPTTISYSNSDNFIGLRATLGSDIFYGYAFTTDNLLNGVVFNDVAGQAITASVNLAGGVPEPATWMMMLLGFGAMGTALRFRKRTALQSAALQPA